MTTDELREELLAGCARIMRAPRLVVSAKQKKLAGACSMYWEHAGQDELDHLLTLYQTFGGEEMAEPKPNRVQELCDELVTEIRSPSEMKGPVIDFLKPIFSFLIAAILEKLRQQPVQAAEHGHHDHAASSCEVLCASLETTCKAASHHEECCHH